MALQNYIVVILPMKLEVLVPPLRVDAAAAEDRGLALETLDTLGLVIVSPSRFRHWLDNTLAHWDVLLKGGLVPELG